MIAKGSLRINSASLFSWINICRGVTGGWGEWSIAHPVFGLIEGASRQWRSAALLLVHPALGSQLAVTPLIRMRLQKDFDPMLHCFLRRGLI